MRGHAKWGTSSLFKLTATAAMVAISVILCRYLGFSPENSPLRFEIGFLPIAYVGHMFGPIWCGVGYFAADVIGSLLSGYAPNPAISLCQLMSGVIMGLVFYKKKMSAPRVCIGMSIIALLIEFLAKTPIFIFIFAYDASVALYMRGINAAVNLPIRIIVLLIAARATEKPLERFIGAMKKNSTEFKSYANSFQAVTVPGLERIGALCRKLGDPQRRLRFIHVAGTNGKGSTCSAMANILTAAGYKTGKYISPNLIRVNERISIDGTDISDEELDRILRRLEPLCLEVEGELGIAPTQFEIWTAAAMLYFDEKGCDYVVLEVGLGGEFDATNVIPRNELAIITRLGLDHTQYLGNTLGEVAYAKSGIIKADSTYGKVITADQEPEALEVIKSRALALGCQVVVPSPVHCGRDGIYEKFDLGDIRGIVAGIAGVHQIENMALAATAAIVMGIDEKYIREGISAAKNPARFELLRTEPTVIYDGGHNENGIEALVKSLEEYFGECEKTVIFACMRDKEIGESLRMLNTAGTEFIFTEVKNNPRADSAEGALRRAEGYGICGVAMERVGDAYCEAIRRGKLTVICGSLYLYKDLQEYFTENLTK